MRVFSTISTNFPHWYHYIVNPCTCALLFLQQDKTLNGAAEVLRKWAATLKKWHKRQSWYYCGIDMKLQLRFSQVHWVYLDFICHFKSICAKLNFVMVLEKWNLVKVLFCLGKSVKDFVLLCYLVSTNWLSSCILVLCCSHIFNFTETRWLP